MSTQHDVRRIALVVLMVIAASAVVAVGGTGVGLILPAAALEGGALYAARAAGVVVLAVGVAALLVQRRGLVRRGDKRPDPTLAALSATGTIMAVLAVVALLAPRLNVEEDAASPADVATGGEPVDEEVPPQSDGTRTGSASPIQGFGLGLARAGPDRRAVQGDESEVLPGGASGFDWSLLDRAASALLLALLLALVVIGIRALRGSPAQRGRTLRINAPVAAADAEAGLEASLGELAYEGDDPRGRITAAYGRLLAALATAGAPRLAYEAPHEHLHRVLGPLGVHPSPMHRLAELYVIAQFSTQMVTERHRAAAAQALEAGLADLRRSNGEVAARGTGVVAGGSAA